ncbi:MAG: hypothetical protein JOZ71_08250 [Ktedonobacteraceae bacterium]|nr:hypothetical protein [Ktedonobacteraceae bacterium]
MYGIELNDEQLEMVAGGSTATATARGTQTTTISGSTLTNSAVISSQVVGASADAHDITGSFNNNELTSQTAKGAGDIQAA